jgi:uncharacterized protein (DUF3084 family)
MIQSEIFSQQSIQDIKDKSQLMHVENNRMKIENENKGKKLDKLREQFSEVDKKWRSAEARAAVCDDLKDELEDKTRKLDDFNNLSGDMKRAMEEIETLKEIEKQYNKQLEHIKKLEESRNKLIEAYDESMDENKKLKSSPGKLKRAEKELDTLVKENK